MPEDHSTQMDALLNMLKSTKQPSQAPGGEIGSGLQRAQSHDLPAPVPQSENQFARPAANPYLQQFQEDQRNLSRSVPPPLAPGSTNQTPQPRFASNDSASAALLGFLKDVKHTPAENAAQREPQQHEHPPSLASQLHSMGDPHLEFQRQQTSAPPNLQQMFAQKPPMDRHFDPQELVNQVMGRTQLQSPANFGTNPGVVHAAAIQHLPADDPPRPESKPVINPEQLMQLFRRPKPEAQDGEPVQQTPQQEKEQPQHLQEHQQGPPQVLPQQEAVEAPAKVETPAERPVSPSTSLLNMLSGAGSKPGLGSSALRHMPSAPTPPLASPSPTGTSTPTGTGKGMFTYHNPFESLSATRPKPKTSGSTRGIESAPTPPPHQILHRSGLGPLKTTIPTPDPTSVPLPFSPPEGPPTISTPDNLDVQIVSATQAPNSALSPAELALHRELFAATEATFTATKQESVEEAEGEPVAESVPPKELEKQTLQEETKPAPVSEVEKERAPSPTPIQEEPIKEEIEEQTLNMPEPELVQPQHQSEATVPFESQTTMVDEHTTGPIYTFPMRPFISLTMNPRNDPESRPPFPEDRLSDIMKMARSHDPLDRNLLTASSSYIAYAISKSDGRGGIRVLRQDDGKAIVLKKDSTDRAFNVTIGLGERLLATSVSGAVLWADIEHGFDINEWSNYSFVYPPVEDSGHTSGVVKSRARKTAKHIDVFAVGRGKTINLIHVPTALAYVNAADGLVDSRRYATDHFRAVDTGKASKDFCFSEDDTVIVSIDKAGKLKLWDVENLVDFGVEYAPGSSFHPQPPKVLTEPTMILSAVAPGETYRATSVMLLDKHRPLVKSMALRYVLVGMKQNYTLQLWDLALNRPVQEINFPQSSDNDPMCSLAYHSPTSNIIVGNPSRNSIFLIHFSAPKYNLAPQSQAQFVRGLAAKDGSVASPEATAILSVIREHTLPIKGQLISLDILDISSQDEPDSESGPALEVYVSHTAGMTSLTLQKDDLCLDSDFRSRHAQSAVEAGICVISTLTPPPTPPTPASPEPQPLNAVVQNGEQLKSPEEPKNAPTVPSPTKVVANPLPAPKQEAKAPAPKKKPASSAAVLANASKTGTDDLSTASSMSRKERKEKAKAKNTPATSVNGPKAAEVPSLDIEAILQRLEKAVSSPIAKDLEALKTYLVDEHKSTQASAERKYEQILQLVSSTLTNNVERALSVIVQHAIEHSLYPKLLKSTADSLDAGIERHLTEKLRTILPDLIRNATASAVQPAVSKVLAETNTKLADFIVAKVRKSTSDNLEVVGKTIRDTFHESQKEAAKRQQNDVAQLLEANRQQNLKIEQLTTLVGQMTQQVQAMAAQQREFQERVNRAQAEWETENSSPQTVQQQQQQAPQYNRPTPQRQPTKTPEEIEAEEVEALMAANDYQNGTIKWLQSPTQQVELFDKVIKNHHFDFSINLNQVVVLSIAAAVTGSFERSIQERLMWLEGILGALNPTDESIVDHVDKIMVVIIQRLEKLYNQLKDGPTGYDIDHSNIMRRIPILAKKARELAVIANNGLPIGVSQTKRPPPQMQPQHQAPPPPPPPQMYPQTQYHQQPSAYRNSYEDDKSQNVRGGWGY